MVLLARLACLFSPMSQCEASPGKCQQYFNNVSGQLCPTVWPGNSEQLISLSSRDLTSQIRQQRPGNILTTGQAADLSQTLITFNFYVEAVQPIAASSNPYHAVK